MAKRKKPASPVRAQEIQDKPDFAADWFREPRAEKKSATSDAASAKLEKDVTVQDRLAPGTMDKLAALKEQMDKEQAAAAAKATAAATKRQPAAVKPRRSPDSGGRPDRDLSFSELFDPVDEDESSFEDMLKDAKQDWRNYK